MAVEIENNIESNEWFAEDKTIRITNRLRAMNTMLKVHCYCFSLDLDLGTRHLAFHEHADFKFTTNGMFEFHKSCSCSFSWGNQSKEFQVFNSEHSESVPLYRFGVGDHSICKSISKGDTQCYSW
ncbi:hypothetical protein ACFE04_006727 [Oxalis oulophora]